MRTAQETGSRHRALGISTVRCMTSTALQDARALGVLEKSALALADPVALCRAEAGSIIS